MLISFVSGRARCRNSNASDRYRSKYTGKVAYGVEVAKRDLVHIIKIFQDGASKLTRAIKMYAYLKIQAHISMMDSEFPVRNKEKEVVEDIGASSNKKYALGPFSLHI